MTTPLFVPLDVADRAAWAAARETVEREFGKLHILVNNAGISVFGPMDRATYADWDWILGVNLGGVINGLATFLPHMEAHGETGHVVNVASMAAFLAGPQAGIYTTSKFAVRGLTESLRYTLAPTALGVSLMCPGLIDTNAYASALKRPAEYAESGLGHGRSGIARPARAGLRGRDEHRGGGAADGRGHAARRLLDLSAMAATRRTSGRSTTS